ncbi:MAG: urease accessory protein UreF [Pseudomonadota bacterium]
MPAITITDGSFFKLLSWMSPSYPVGAYAFSQGLEQAVDSGLVTNRRTAGDWIRCLLSSGNGGADLVFLGEAWDLADDLPALRELAEYSVAFQTTCELRAESLAQGRAFAVVTENAWPVDGLAEGLAALAEQQAYPVVVGFAAAKHGIDKEAGMLAFIHAYTANLVSAAVRLVPLGQTDGQRITAEVHEVAGEVMARASSLTRHTVTSSTFMADIASMRHETQYTRLFQS